jgi:hypothetical protein
LETELKGRVDHLKEYQVEEANRSNVGMGLTSRECYQGISAIGRAGSQIGASGVEVGRIHKTGASGTNERRKEGEGLLFGWLYDNLKRIEGTSPLVLLSEDGSLSEMWEVDLDPLKAW